MENLNEPLTLSLSLSLFLSSHCSEEKSTSRGLNSSASFLYCSTFENSARLRERRGILSKLKISA